MSLPGDEDITSTVGRELNDEEEPPTVAANHNLPKCVRNPNELIRGISNFEEKIGSTHDFLPIKKMKSAWID